MTDRVVRAFFRSELTDSGNSRFMNKGKYFLIYLFKELNLLVPQRIVVFIKSMILIGDGS